MHYNKQHVTTTTIISRYSFPHLGMCGVCGLPTTHVGTLQAASLIPIFLFVFGTFVWAWWMVTRLRIENYFLNRYQQIAGLLRRR
jgi:hypothetical protein